MNHLDDCDDDDGTESSLTSCNCVIVDCVVSYNNFHDNEYFIVPCICVSVPQLFILFV